jgi:hypothetical protein
VKTQAQTLISSLAFLFSFAFLSMSATAQWSGWARCEINIQKHGPSFGWNHTGYRYKETHTWTFQGAPLNVPTTGKWTAVGWGYWDQGNPTGTQYEWTINPASTVYTGGQFRVSDAGGKVSIKRTSVQPNISDGIKGTIQQMNRRPTSFTWPLREWPDFPTIEGPAGSQTLSGRSSSNPSFGWAFQQPLNVGETFTASYSWWFAYMTTPPPPPPVKPGPPKFWRFWEWLLQLSDWKLKQRRP